MLGHQTRCIRKQRTNLPVRTTLQVQARAHWDLPISCYVEGISRFALIKRDSSVCEIQMCCAYKLFLNKNGHRTNSWCPFNLLIRSNKHIATGKATTCHNKLSIREPHKHETATARASNVRPSLHIFLAREFWMLISSLKCFNDLLHMIIMKRHESSVLLLDSGDEILGIFGGQFLPKRPATFAWPLVMRLQWINLGCCFWWSSTLQTTTPGSIPEAVQPCWIKLVATNVCNSNWVDDKTEGKKQQAISDTRHGITQKRQHQGTLSTVVLIFNRILRSALWLTPHLGHPNTGVIQGTAALKAVSSGIKSCPLMSR